jgi:uncharacterized protein (DUF2237 family)
MTFNASPPNFVNHPATFVPLLRQTDAPMVWPEAMAVMPESALNVLGEPLQLCGCEPMTGWYRDGSCRTDGSDLGRHTVCCVVDENFLSYSRAQGNDLSTPAPQYGFPGLKPGDHWCVCAGRWLEAYEDGMAPPVRLEACEQSTLELIPLEVLQGHAATAA